MCLECIQKLNLKNLQKSSLKILTKKLLNSGAMLKKNLIFKGRIQRVYRDRICKSGEEALSFLYLVDIKNYLVVKRLIADGARFEVTEDSLLVAESDSWVKLSKIHPSNTIIFDLHCEVMRERDLYISKNR